MEQGKDKPKNPERRQFLKVVGAALGAGALSALGCRGNEGSGTWVHWGEPIGAGAQRTFKINEGAILRGGPNMGGKGLRLKNQIEVAGLLVLGAVYETGTDGFVIKTKDGEYGVWGKVEDLQLTDEKGKTTKETIFVSHNFFDEEEAEKLKASP